MVLEEKLIKKDSLVPILFLKVEQQFYYCDEF